MGVFSSAGYDSAWTSEAIMTKEHILSEIRRTAGANGDAPLGVDRFFTETGIKESDWHGKFWARWGDAVREAGFQPNQLTTARTTEDLLTKLAGLVRELGRFPVRGELRLEARADSTFPSDKTLRRLGGKQALAAQLEKFCRDRGQNDLAELCAAAAAKNDDAQDAEGVPEGGAEAELGYVYLMKSGRFYKIGRTNALGRRERELVIQLPEAAKVIHSIKTDDPVGIEEYWHRRFQDRRRNGEWFDLTPQDLSAFRRRKFM
jgi:hypothetical protein